MDCHLKAVSGHTLQAYNKEDRADPGGPCGLDFACKEKSKIF